MAGTGVLGPGGLEGWDEDARSGGSPPLLHRPGALLTQGNGNGGDGDSATSPTPPALGRPVSPASPALARAASPVGATTPRLVKRRGAGRKTAAAAAAVVAAAGDGDGVQVEVFVPRTGTEPPATPEQQRRLLLRRERAARVSSRSAAAVAGRAPRVLQTGRGAGHWRVYSYSSARGAAAAAADSGPAGATAPRTASALLGSYATDRSGAIHICDEWCRHHQHGDIRGASDQLPRGGSGDSGDSGTVAWSSTAKVAIHAPRPPSATPKRGTGSGSGSGGKGRVAPQAAQQQQQQQQQVAPGLVDQVVGDAYFGRSWRIRTASPTGGSRCSHVSPPHPGGGRHSSPSPHVTLGSPSGSSKGVHGANGFIPAHLGAAVQHLQLTPEHWLATPSTRPAPLWPNQGPASVVARGQRRRRRRQQQQQEQARQRRPATASPQRRPNSSSSSSSNNGNSTAAANKRSASAGGATPQHQRRAQREEHARAVFERRLAASAAADLPLRARCERFSLHSSLPQAQSFNAQVGTCLRGNTLGDPVVT